MATYYVDPINGSDANDGAEGTPFKTNRLACAIASGTDSIVLAGGDSILYREGFCPANAVPISATGGYAHFLSAIDVSHGTTRENLIKNGDASQWVSSQEPFNNTIPYVAPVNTAWTSAHFSKVIAGTINPSYVEKETTIVRGGVNSFHLRRGQGSSQCEAYWGIYKIPGETLTITFWHRRGSTVTAPRIRIRHDGTTSYYQIGSSSWTTTSTLQDVFTSSETEWTQETITIADDPASFAANQCIWLNLNCPTDNASVYISDIRVTGASQIFSWTADTGTTVQTGLVWSKYGDQFGHLLTCTRAAWESEGADALRNVSLAASLAACRSTANSCFYNTTTGVLYYTPAAGVDVTDLHIEAVIGYSDSIVAAMHFNYAGTYSDLVIHGGRRTIQFSAAATCTRVFACDGTDGTDIGEVLATGAISPVLNNCASIRGDGFAMNGGASPVFNGTLAFKAWDDGFQALAASGFTANNCIAMFSGREGVSGNQQFIVEGTEANPGFMHLNQCLAYGGLQGGIDWGSASGRTTSSATNCLSLGNGVEGYFDMVAPLGDLTDVTLLNNAYQTYTPEMTPDSSDITEGLDAVLADLAAALDDMETWSNAQIRSWVASPSNPLSGDSILKGAGLYRALATDIRGRRRKVPTTIGPWEFSSGDKAAARTSRAA